MSLTIELKVVPSSGTSKIIMDKSGTLKCYVKAPAQDGKANQELIRMLADKLDIGRAVISIVHGLTSRRKKIKIELPLTLQDVMHKLGIEVQQVIL